MDCIPRYDRFIQGRKHQLKKVASNVFHMNKHNTPLYKYCKELSQYERQIGTISPKKKRSLQNRINKLEKMIEELEQNQRDIDLELSDPEKFKELSHKDGFFEQYEKNKQKKQQLESEWSQAVEELEIYS